MKTISTMLILILSVTSVSAQQETFDVTAYTAPRGWKKVVTEPLIQFSKEDTAKGSYCLISLYKAVAGTTGSKNNFEVAWASLVKEVMKVTAAPEMLEASTENGWETQSGYAPFDYDGNKGVVMLATATGSGKMVNMIVLTNTGDYEKEISDFISSISLAKNEHPPVKQASAPKNKPATDPSLQKLPAGSGFAFTTTNFDDGWTSVVKEDWVEVTKGKWKVLLHYPTDGIKAANTDVDVMCSAAWNYLVAPRYSNMQNYLITPGVLDYERPYYAEATLTDKASGATVFVVLFKKATGWIEFIMPDKKTFIEAFGLDISKVNYYSDSGIWNKMKQMNNYNRFAIAASDFTGKWQDRFSANTYYTNIYTGLSAGMSTYSSSQSFEFSANNTYKWNLVAANSRGGASQFASAKGSGTFKVLSNWQIFISEMEGKPQTFDAYFSCVKGGRILWMKNTRHPSDSFTGFAKE